jgi:hypothetical protein
MIVNDHVSNFFWASSRMIYFVLIQFLISFATSPFKKTELFNSCFVSEFEATYFVTLLIPGHLSTCFGQYEANISNVLLPSSKFKGLVTKEI